MYMGKFVFFAVLLISGYVFVYPKSDFKLIKEPAFSHDDSLIPVTELKVVRQIDLNFTKDFVALIGDMSVAPNGNVFVYDSKQVKLFQLNKNQELAATFAKSGQGPGELMQMGNYKSVYLNAGWDNKLYLYNHPNKILHVYSQSGTYLSTIQPVDSEFTIGKPTADRDGSLAMVCREGKLAVYTPKNGKYEQKIIVIDHDLCSRFLFLAPNETDIDATLKDSTYLSYGYLADGRLAVWISTCGELLLYDKQLKLVATHSIRPQKALSNFKNKLNAETTRSGDRYRGFAPFGKMIGSVGNPEEYLILSFAFQGEKNTEGYYGIEFYSYVFDKQLKIKKVCKMPSNVSSLFSYKDKDHFWAVDSSKTALLLMQ